MFAAEMSTEQKHNPSGGAQAREAELALPTVKVYTRHKRICPKRDRSDWARCNCMKWLYIYRDGKCKLASAKARSWEKAERKAREILDSFDPIRQLNSNHNSAHGAKLRVEKAQVGKPTRKPMARHAAAGSVSVALSHSDALHDQKEPANSFEDF
jgi:hypothetical protein